MLEEATRDVRVQSQHLVSDCLSSRYPFPTPAPFDLTAATTAFGRRSVEKALDVLAYFLEEGDGSKEETAKITENIRLLEEQLGTQTSKSLAIATGGAEIHTRLLDHADAGVRRLAARVIGRLATERDGRAHVCELRGVQKLCALLKDNDLGVRQAASLALKHIAATEESQRVLVQMEEVVPDIVSALPGLTGPALSESLMTLANLCRFPEASMLTPWTSIVPHVVKGMKSKNLDVQDAATRCLVCIAGHPQGKVAAIEAEAIEALVPLLAHSSLETQRMAGSAMLLLAVNSDAKNKAEPCINNLIEMLYCEDRDVAMNGLLSLRSIAEAPQQREIILERLAQRDHKMFDKVFNDQKIHLAANRYM